MRHPTRPQRKRADRRAPRPAPRKPLPAGRTLAIEGGEPVRRGPLSPWPVFASDEIDAVSDVLRSGHVNYWTGTQGRSFEREFADFAKVPHAVAVSNGTVALEAALAALEIGPGHEVVVPCRTFIATASAVAARGATPVCADVDRDSQNLTAATLEAALTPRTRAVIAVHLAGWPCDMDPLLALARARGLRVIEDCAQSLGAEYRGAPTGTLGDIAAFSFCQDKILTTAGEGGMVTTRDPDLANRIWSFKDHGKSREAAEAAPVGVRFRWVHEAFGTNGRMTEVQAALGRKALLKVPGWLERRRKNAAALTRRLAPLPGLRIPLPPSGTSHAYYKYYCFVEADRLKPGWSRDRILDAVLAEGVPCFPGACPEIYKERAFRNLPPPSRPFPVARLLGETSIMLQVHPTLTERECEDTGRAVEKVMAAACR